MLVKKDKFNLFNCQFMRKKKTTPVFWVPRGRKNSPITHADQDIPLPLPLPPPLPLS